MKWLTGIMQTHKYLIHSDGPLLWPGHQDLDEVLKIKATTPLLIWAGTYLGNPTPSGGYTFKRTWWADKNRYDYDDKAWSNQCVGRWISWDTAEEAKETSAYSAYVVGELTPDYRMCIRRVKLDRIEFPALPGIIEQVAERHNRDGKLKACIVEYKSSGVQAMQTLLAVAPDWLKALMVSFSPTISKEQRGQQAAVWCKNGSVLLPHPSDSNPWLMDFEDHLFDFPQSSIKDDADAFNQLIMYTENLLAAGWHTRQPKQQVIHKNERQRNGRKRGRI
ncbi:MAG: hypothetical protein GY938_32045 [Ketobacter sp.]|nr:hypothetical protein [Ketobacter sp.]